MFNKWRIYTIAQDIHHNENKKTEDTQMSPVLICQNLLLNQMEQFPANASPMM